MSDTPVSRLEGARDLAEPPATPAPACRRLPCAVLALLCLALIALSFGNYARTVFRSPDSQFDDAYMIYRYARNFLDGHGLAWNAGEGPVYGPTSLLHTFVMIAALAATGAGPQALLKLVAAPMAPLAVLVMAFACAALARSPLLRGRYLVWTAVLGALLLPDPLLVYHALTGMDTALIILLNSLFVWVTFRMMERQRARDIAWVVLVGYLSFLTRPDNGLYVYIFPGLAVLLLGPREGRWRLLARFGVIMTAVLAIDTAAKHFLLGDVLPLSFYRKSRIFDAGYAGMEQWNPVAFLLLFVGSYSLYVSLIILSAGRRTLRILIVFALPVAVTFTYYFFALQAMGFRARFYMPALPFLVIGAALMLDGQLRENGQLTLRRSGAPLRIVAMLLFLALLPVAAWRLPPLYAKAFFPRVDRVDARNFASVRSAEPLPALDWWPAIVEVARLAEAAPSGTVMSLTELGWVGAAAPRVAIVDPTGLHDAYFAHHGFSIAEFLRRKPDLIWMPHPDYVQILRELLTSDEFWRDYDYYPGFLTYGMALRRDSPRHDALQELLAETWQRNYPALRMENHLARRIAPSP